MFNIQYPMPNDLALSLNEGRATIAIDLMADLTGAESSECDRKNTPPYLSIISKIG
jgi:hypothetical protein